jgi:hypothetical protein
LDAVGPFPESYPQAFLAALSGWFSFGAKMSSCCKCLYWPEQSYNKTKTRKTNKERNDKISDTQILYPVGAFVKFARLYP